MRGMSESRDPSPPPAVAPSLSSPTAADLPLISPVLAPSSPLVRVGGLFGIAGCALGLILFLVGCAGYANSLKLSYGSAGLGALGLLVTLAGALFQKRRIGEDTHVLQALFACLMSLVGGVLLMAIWLKWPILK
jgi:hypothetical protein